MGSFLLAFLAVFPAYSQDLEFGMPEAVVTSENDVSLEEARSVARQMAGQRWDRPALGAVIPACDREGHLVAYQIVFRLDAKPFGDEASIRERVRGSRGGARTATARPRDVFDPAKAHKSEKWVPGAAAPANVSASSPPSSPLATGYRQEEFPSNEPWLGKGEYGTVVVSAQKSRVPVPRVIHGLPSYYTQLDLAVERHQGRLGGKARIKKLVYLSPAEEYFEIQGTSGTARVHAHTLREDPGPVKKKASPPRLTAEQKARNNRLIAAEWEKYGIR